MLEHVGRVVLVAEREGHVVAQFQHFLQDRHVRVDAAPVERHFDSLARALDGARVENREHGRVRERDLRRAIVSGEQWCVPSNRHRQTDSGAYLELAVGVLLEARDEVVTETLELLGREAQFRRLLRQVLVVLNAELGELLLPLLDLLLLVLGQLKPVALKVLHELLDVALAHRVEFLDGASTIAE